LNDNQVPADPIVTIVYRASKLKRTPCSANICMNIADDYDMLSKKKYAQGRKSNTQRVCVKFCGSIAFRRYSSDLFPKSQTNESNNYF